MKTNDNMNDNNHPMFMGAKIWRYKLINRNCQLVYSCVTQSLPQNYVIEQLEAMFETYHMPIRIYCNGKQVKRICEKDRVTGKVIVDRLEKRRYKNLSDMADELEISLKQAKMLLERHMRYYWEKE